MKKSDAEVYYKTVEEYWQNLVNGRDFRDKAVYLTMKAMFIAGAIAASNLMRRGMKPETLILQVYEASTEIRDAQEIPDEDFLQ
jgi:hypothetical protein